MVSILVNLSIETHNDLGIPHFKKPVLKIRKHHIRSHVEVVGARLIDEAGFINAQLALPKLSRGSVRKSAPE